MRPTVERNHGAVSPGESALPQIVVPIYNEGGNVVTLYERLFAAQIPFRTLSFIYDLDTDTSLPFIAELRAKDPRVSASRNQLGRGVLNALRWGFAQVDAGPVVVMMGDNSDKLTVIPDMVAAWRRGATVVSPSRYMRGGKQHGGPLLKKTLSRLAGVSLKLFGFPVSDPTNNFKLYDGGWLKAQEIESVGGFEIALELCHKAYLQNRVLVELPTEWWDRTEGESRFKLWTWLPRYLRWYLLALREIVRRRIRGVPLRAELRSPA